LFFNGGGTDVQVATQEAKSLIGFTTDVVDVTFPFEVLVDGNSQILSMHVLYGIPHLISDINKIEMVQRRAARCHQQSTKYIWCW
jgi:succinate dehydrogenase/fumarate reductase cytochrome b subunit